MQKNITTLIKKITRKKFVQCALIVDAILLLFYFFGISFTSVFFGQVVFQFFILSLVIICIFSLTTRWFKLKWLNITTKILTILGGIYLVPLFLFIYMFSIFTLIDTYNQGYDPGFEKIHETQLEHTKLVVYKTNCGATCDFGISVVQEENIFPGLKITKSIFNYYHAYNLEYERVDNNKVKVIKVDMSNEQNLDPTPSVGDILSLDPWLYILNQ